MDQLSTLIPFVPRCVTRLLAILATVSALTVHSYWETERHELLEIWLDLTGTTTLEELQPAPVDEANNAAPLYIRAGERIRLAIDTDEDHWAVDDVDDLTDEQLQARRDDLERISDELALLHEAVRRPDCLWPHDTYRSGIGAELNHLNAVRFASIMLCQAAAHADNPALAEQHLLATLRLREHTLVDPFIMPLLTAVSMEQLVLDAIEHDGHDLPARSLRMIDEALLAVDWAEALRQSIIGEALWSKHAVRYETDELTFATRAAMASLGWTTAREKVAIMEIYLAALRTIESRPADRDWSFLADEAVDELPTMTQRLLPSIRMTVSNVEVAELRRTLLRTAIALRLHHDHHGKFPERWDMPHDPFTENPMRYERHEDGSGFTLRSDAVWQSTWRKGETKAECTYRLPDRDI